MDKLEHLSHPEFKSLMENPAIALEEFIAKVMQAERIRQSLIQMQTSSINRIHVLPEANKPLRKISRNNILS